MTVDLRVAFYVRRSDVLRSNLGVDKNMFEAARAAGLLRPVPLPGMKRGLYKRDDVLRVFRVVEESVK
jgi:hypothetical protein